MTAKVVGITEKNFSDIPRPANKRFNCQECFYWMGKRDGKHDLTKEKKNWFVRKAKEHDGPLGKLLLWGRKKEPVGFIQFGPLFEFQTAQRIYGDKLSSPRKGWCITCVAIQTHYRGKGLATRLIRNVLRDLKRRGVKTVDVYPLKKARSWNQFSVGPVGLWEKCGFEKIVEKENEILMRRKL